MYFALAEASARNNRSLARPLLRIPLLYQFNTEEINMAEEEGAASVASNFIWALAFVVIVAMVVGAFYYGGFLSGKKKTEVDINITAPAR